MQIMQYRILIWVINPFSVSEHARSKIHGYYVDPLMCFAKKSANHVVYFP